MFNNGYLGQNVEICDKKDANLCTAERVPSICWPSLTPSVCVCRFSLAVMCRYRRLGAAGERAARVPSRLTGPAPCRLCRAAWSSRPPAPAARAAWARLDRAPDRWAPRHQPWCAAAHRSVTGQGTGPVGRRSQASYGTGRAPGHGYGRRCQSRPARSSGVDMPHADDSGRSLSPLAHFPSSGCPQEASSS